MPPGGITSQIHRGGGIRGALKAAKKLGLQPGPALYRDAEDSEAVQRYLHSGRRKDRPAKLAAIALLYDQAMRDGYRNVAEVIVEATNLKYKTVTDWVRAARCFEPPS